MGEYGFRWVIGPDKKRGAATPNGQNCVYFEFDELAAAPTRVPVLLAERFNSADSGTVLAYVEFKRQSVPVRD